MLNYRCDCGFYGTNPLRRSQMETLGTGNLLTELSYLELTIPAWQMALFIATLSVFMLIQRIKLCLIITYLFTFYWGFFLYWGDVMTSLDRFPIAATSYLIFGALHIVLTLVVLYRSET